MTATAVWNSTVLPWQARSWRTATSADPGLAQQAAVERGDLIGADHERVRRPRCCAPSRGRDARPSLPGASPRDRVLVDVRATRVVNGSCSRDSSSRR